MSTMTKPTTKPKTFLLYSSLQVGKDRQEVKSPSGHSIFIRVEESYEGGSDTLCNARPKSDEIVLNTIPAEARNDT